MSGQKMEKSMAVIMGRDEQKCQNWQAWVIEMEWFSGIELFGQPLAPKSQVSTDKMDFVVSTRSFLLNDRFKGVVYN
jgi:hypothetical protein